jgi:hypothetical protein
MYPEGRAKCMAWVVATFNLSAAASTDVSLYSEDQVISKQGIIKHCVFSSRKSLVRNITILFKT